MALMLQDMVHTQCRMSTACLKGGLHAHREPSSHGVSRHAPDLCGGLLAAFGVPYHIGASQHHCHHNHKQVICRAARLSLKEQCAPDHC